jgi:hypothetical protein
MAMTSTVVIKVSAAIEFVTGLALIIAPRAVVELLFGGTLGGPGVPVGRIGGIALLSLALACWPYSEALGGMRSAHVALLIYNLLVAALLFYLGWTGEFTGFLLWPAALLHGVIALLLAFARRRA